MGVVINTTELHIRAWKELFDEELPEIGGNAVPAFDPVEDYRRHVDGRSREDGVRTVLSARGLAVPPLRRGTRPGRCRWSAGCS